jgi:hypothetical protein
MFSLIIGVCYCRSIVFGRSHVALFSHISLVSVLGFVHLRPSHCWRFLSPVVFQLKYSQCLNKTWQCPHTQMLRPPDPVPSITSERRKLTGVSCSSWCTGWCLMWAEAVSVAFTLEASCLCALEAAADCRQVYRLWRLHMFHRPLSLYPPGQQVSKSRDIHQMYGVGGAHWFLYLRGRAEEPRHFACWFHHF